MEQAIEIQGVTKTYKKSSVKALDNITFSVKAGEIFGLLGPNGAGKTSLIGILTTLQEPDVGQIKVLGFNVQQEPWNTKPLLGVVGQEVVSHGFFNIEEILDFHSGYYGLSKNKERIDFLIHRLSLWDHRKKKVNQLSGGMKRRLMIAKALVHSPKVLLLDEPTAGVDSELRDSLWQFVRELRDQGMTVLLTTHYLQEAEELCDRIGVIDKGSLIYLGDKKNLVQKMSNRCVVVELKPTAPQLILVIAHPNLINRSMNKLTFVVPKNISVGHLLSSTGIVLEDIVDIEIREGGLEEAMRRLLKGELS
jgi:ABC-2 type transport system ATP-binding protein